VNPLLVKLSGEFGAKRNWSQFLANWEKANEPWEWECLLHKGHEVSFEKLGYHEVEYEPVDRTLFYLSCADGWLRPHELPIKKENSAVRVHSARHEKGVALLSNYQLTVMLLEKAMKMLCQYELKPWENSYPDWNYPDYHMKYFTSADLLPALMHFFGDVSDDGKFSYYNFKTSGEFGKGSHISEQIYGFVMRLIKTILCWSEQSFRFKHHFRSRDETEILKNEEFIASQVERFNIAKAWATEMLASMHDLTLFRKMDALDSVTISTLQKIELRIVNKKVKTERLVKNHEEALECDSEVAWFLDRYFKTHPQEVSTKPRKTIRRRRKSRVVSR